eukprot:UN17785
MVDIVASIVISEQKGLDDRITAAHERKMIEEYENEVKRKVEERMREHDRIAAEERQP